MTLSKAVQMRTMLGFGAALAVGTALLQVVASAQSAEGALLIVDASGQPVGVLVPSAVGPVGAPIARPAAVADPMLEMMALQQAMTRQMQADMAGLTQTAAGVAGTGLVIRSVTTGSDGCSHTVVWQQGPADHAPRLVLDRVADRCAGTDGHPPSALPGLQSIVDVQAASKPTAHRPF